MLLTNLLGSGIFENARGEKLAEFLHSSRRFGRIYGLLTGSFGIKSTKYREFCEFVFLDFWRQKFILSSWACVGVLRIVRVRIVQSECNGKAATPCGMTASELPCVVWNGERIVALRGVTATCCA